MTRTYHRGTQARKAILVALLAGIAAAYGFQRWRPFRVEVAGTSMLPTLEPGDWALAVRVSARAPRRRRRRRTPRAPGFELVKRVVHVPGDVAPDGPELVDEIWIEGDEPEGSSDSRRFGPVAVGRVRARVRRVWWPPERARSL